MNKVTCMIALLLLVAGTAMSAPVFRVSRSGYRLLKAWSPAGEYAAAEVTNDGVLILSPSPAQYAAGWGSLSEEDQNALLVDALLAYSKREESRDPLLVSDRLRDTYQARKSVLHKAADNALITVLIRGGFLPEGSTSVPAGTDDSVTLQLLQAEAVDPDNVALQALGTKLDKLRGIVRAEGGHPEDAIVHEDI
jgi:hypothetical protein